MKKLFKSITVAEWLIWGISSIAIIVGFFVFENDQYHYLVGSLIGVTALIFVAKGNPLGQILVIIFSVFYGIISYTFAYYGEMITYLGMSAPIAIWALISWLRHPSENRNEVKVNSISLKEWILFLTGSCAVTAAFYFILRALNTSNLIISTLSVLTSFTAAYLAARRSRFYAIFYSLNDIVLIVLWAFAVKESITYLPMVICFAAFLANDIYAFINWGRMKKRQRAEEAKSLHSAENFNEECEINNKMNGGIMSSFKDLRIVDNFYQTSAFFPMPTILVGTLSEDGKTNLGAYSLCFPYYIAGKDYYAMVLECRNSSNTAQNILRGSKVSLNFIPDDKKYFREAVRLGFPGDTTAEKMKNCLFTLEKGLAEGVRPLVLAEAFQVFECSWDSSLENAFEDKAGCTEGYESPYRNFNGITSKFGAHFILKIDKILMKDKYYNSIVNGVRAKDFPPVPVDYGYRDSVNFWCSPFRRPFPEKIQAKEGDVNSVKYAAKRIDPEVTFTDEACAKLTKIPRIFLKAALSQMVEIAKEEGIKVIDEAALEVINDKRRKEKK